MSQVAENEETESKVGPDGKILGHMELADSFTLPDLSDDEEDFRPRSEKLRGSDPVISGRSIRAAAKTTGGSLRLTDGFGEFTAAIPGRRTALVEKPKSPPRADGENAEEEYDDDRSQQTEVEKEEAAAANMDDTVAVPVDPDTVPTHIAERGVGNAPPFVWTPGQYVSAENSEIRITSILDSDALDSVQFARPRPAASTPKPRASADSRKVISKAYGGPGRCSETQLFSSEIDEISLLRGTPFSPFSVQRGRPRGEWTHDAPWDRTTRNMAGNALWRRPGDDCDRTVKRTTKQGFAPRGEEHQVALARGSAGEDGVAAHTHKFGVGEFRERVTQSAGGRRRLPHLEGAGGGGNRATTAAAVTTNRSACSSGGGSKEWGDERGHETEVVVRRGGRGGGFGLANLRYALADPTGVVGGAGRRGGTLKPSPKSGGDRGARGVSTAGSGGGRKKSTLSGTFSSTLMGAGGGGLVVPFSSTFLSTMGASSSAAAGGPNGFDATNNNEGTGSRPSTAPPQGEGEGGGRDSSAGQQPLGGSRPFSSTAFSARAAKGLLSAKELERQQQEKGAAVVEQQRQVFLSAVKEDDADAAAAAYRDFVAAAKEQQKRVHGPDANLPWWCAAGASGDGGVGAQKGERRRQRSRGEVPGTEYLIHHDPLSQLDPAALKLLEEKNIALRLFSPKRNDARAAVRSRFAASTDKFKDSNVIGHGLLEERVITQGLDSVHLTHSTDEVDALKPESLVQTSRRGNEFPVPPWDGTMRNIAANDIGLWRDPGWDLHPPKGDSKLELRRTASSLFES